jgi:uncharacterized membrane protein
MPTRLWTGPLCGLAGGLVLALAMLAIDQSTGYRLIPESITGTPAAAQTLVSVILTAVVTLISVVLTVMTVAVQLAMGQFSPRIVTALLLDRGQRFAFGLFTATGAFCIVALRGIDDRHDHVPGLTVLTVYVLAVITLGVLILFVSKAGSRLRASGLIDLVSDELHVEIDHRFPAAGAAAPPRRSDAVPAPRPGVVVAIDTDGLVAVATRADVVLELLVRMGDFIPQDAPLVVVHGGGPAAVPDVTRFISLQGERTHDRDPAYGLRKLVDIGIRSAADDPSTTVEALHRIHDSMRQLAWRPFPTGRHSDARGRLRLIVPVRSWDDYVQLAFEEIRLAGAGQPQITRRLRAALEDLRSVAAPERHPVLDDQLRLLEGAVRRTYPEDLDARLALTPDPQGVG